MLVLFKVLRIKPTAFLIAGILVAGVLMIGGVVDVRFGTRQARMELELESISIEKDEGTGAILGHAGFIKTVEDLYEAMLCSVPGVKFGIAFAEASGPCLVRSEGNDEGLRTQAEKSILKIAAGHTFLILFTGAYPINVIANVRNVSEVATVYCATSNPVKVIVAKVENGRSVIGIIDGLSSRAIESKDDKQSRSRLLRDLGYKK